MCVCTATYSLKYGWYPPLHLSYYHQLLLVLTCVPFQSCNVLVVVISLKAEITREIEVPLLLCMYQVTTNLTTCRSPSSFRNTTLQQRHFKDTQQRIFLPKTHQISSEEEQQRKRVLGEELKRMLQRSLTLVSSFHTPGIRRGDGEVNQHQSNWKLLESHCLCLQALCCGVGGFDMAKSSSNQKLIFLRGSIKLFKTLLMYLFNESKGRRWTETKLISSPLYISYVCMYDTASTNQ